MTHFTLWAVAFDAFYGERERPVGFAIREVAGTIKFTDEYKKAHR